MLALIATKAGEARADEHVGHLQIPAAPGVIAEVDGRVSARSQDQYGVIIRDLSPGPHRLLLRRPGAAPQRAVVEVSVGEVTVFTPRPWTAAPTDTAATGMLMIQTLPVETTIKAPTLGWPELTKNRAAIRVVTPAGDHRVTVCDAYRCLDYRLNVAAGRLRSVLVDLDQGEVDDLSATHASRWAQHRRACDAFESTDAVVSCQRACDLDSALLPGAYSSACARLVPDVEIDPTSPASVSRVASVPKATHEKGR